jgi:16S rRNA (guanine1207-N2)-methyltransferase
MRSVMAEHYFSAEPAVPASSRLVEFEAAGRRFQLAAASGVFSADRLDPGTAVLLRKAPLPAADEEGALLDLGCGYGPIALALAAAAPRATVYAVDVNRRALDLVRRNAAAHGLNVVAALPEEVDPALRFAQLWSNPPIRVGKDNLYPLLAGWLARLDGTGWLVVARHLGGDSLQAWLTAHGWPAIRHASAKGYRVLRVTGNRAT